MAKDYYNQRLFSDCIKDYETRPNSTKENLEEYMKNYPNDFSAYPFYATILINLGLLDEAEEFLQKMLVLASRCNNIIKSSKKMKYMMYGYYLNMLKILIFKKKYFEALDFCHTYEDEIKKVNPEFASGSIEFFCAKKAGIIDISKHHPRTYLFNQTLEYSEERFVEHIKKHQQIYNGSEQSVCVFNEDFPIDNILKEIKKYIPSDKKLYHGFTDNIYLFKYDNCGRENYKLTDYFKVITFDGTSDIITMCPNIGNYDYEYVDLNYLNDEKEDSKVKVLSQIDKFNLRYKKK